MAADVITKAESRAQQKRMKKEMSESAFRRDFLELAERHFGRLSFIHRSPTGFPKLLSVNFGPKNYPSFNIEIRDRGRPEDPMEMMERTRIDRDKKQDKIAAEMERAVKDALEVQREELAIEWGITPADPEAAKHSKPKAKAAEDRWSKKSFTDAVADALGLGATEKCVQIRESGNVILVSDGDQTFKINVSMPRKK